jgi:CheY-like chemotaxis protein
VLFTDAAQNKGLRIDMGWSGPEHQRYLGDPQRLRQMLNNFVNNAIKFTEAGRVGIEARESDRDEATALLEFSVTDTGCGIPEDKQSLLFKPFSQADSSITRKFGGTGLGLSIVDRLARLMGGEVGVESQPGRGSRFWIRIRAKLVAGDQDTRHSPRDAGKVPTAPTQLSGSLLVAEDNRINQKVITVLLQRLGLTVELAENGSQAVDLLRQGLKPDLVLMDIQMPVMDGYTATQHIRQWESEQHIARVPIVALTADVFEEDRQRCLAVGMDDYLLKPVAFEMLQALLLRWLKPAATAAELVASERPLDQHRLVDLLSRLRPLLLEKRYDSLKLYREVEAVAKNTTVMDEFSDMGNSLLELEFDRAMAKLDEITCKHAWSLPQR